MTDAVVHDFLLECQELAMARDLDLAGMMVWKRAPPCNNPAGGRWEYRSIGMCFFCQNRHGYQNTLGRHISICRSNPHGPRGFRRIQNSIHPVAGPSNAPAPPEGLATPNAHPYAEPWVWPHGVAMQYNNQQVPYLPRSTSFPSPTNAQLMYRSDQVQEHINDDSSGNWSRSDPGPSRTNHTNSLSTGSTPAYAGDLWLNQDGTQFIRAPQQPQNVPQPQVPVYDNVRVPMVTLGAEQQPVVFWEANTYVRGHPQYQIQPRRAEDSNSEMNPDEQDDGSHGSGGHS